MSRRMWEGLIWGFGVYASAEQSGIFPKLYAPPGSSS